MKLNLKPLLIICMYIPLNVHAGQIYQCENADGGTAYQDQPCDGGVVEFNEDQSGFTNAKYKDEMVKILTKLTKKSGKNLNDPKIKKAAEAMAMVDAGKSYAFTQIHGVAVKHCGAPVKKAMAKYQSNASDIIALGKYYYTNGIHVQLGEKKISQSGKELTDALQGMLDKMDREHAAAGKDKLKQKCNDATSALGMLAMLYSN